MAPSTPPPVGILVDGYAVWLAKERRPTGIQRVAAGLLQAAAVYDDRWIRPVATSGTGDRPHLAEVEGFGIGSVGPVAPTTDAKSRRVLSWARRIAVKIPLGARGRRVARDLYLRLATRSAGLQTAGPVALGEGSVLVLPDWDAVRIGPLRHLVAQGIRVRLVVHDLFPIRNPEWFPPEFRRTYVESIDTIVPMCDRIVTLTPLVASHVVDRFPNVAQRIRVAAPTLAIGRPRYTSSADDESDPVPGAYVLVFGTVEPRKNVGAVLEAWRIVRDGSGLTEPWLVIAGQKGWLSDAIERQIGESRESHVIRFERPSDGTLGRLLDGCHATIHASWAEGFGLPVRESVARGIPTLMSTSIPIDGLPPGSVELFDPAQPGQLADLIVRVFSRPMARAQLDLGEGTGWEPVLEALVAEDPLLTGGVER